MIRQRVDGLKFQDEFDSAMQKRYTVLRLHTPGMKYAGLTQPADFIVIGDTVSYVELKETGKDSYSFSAIEQLEEIKKFVAEKPLRKAQTQAKMQYLIVVHFFKHKVIKVVTAERALQLLINHTTLKYDDNELAFNSLQALREGGQL